MYIYVHTHIHVYIQGWKLEPKSDLQFFSPNQKMRLNFLID